MCSVAVMQQTLILIKYQSYILLLNPAEHTIYHIISNHDGHFTIDAASTMQLK
jgi:hypothetical protein